MLDAAYPAEQDVPPPGGDVVEAGRAVSPVKGREQRCVEGGKGTWKAKWQAERVGVCLPVLSRVMPRPIPSQSGRC